MTDEQTTFERHKRRRDAVWQDRSAWDHLYEDVYKYVIPHRRPGGQGRQKNPVDNIFDMTATMSAMQFAGSLQNDLFPAGVSPFNLESGPVARSRLGAAAAQLDRALERMADGIYPFFLTGEWDTAVHETCIDLGIGTGALLPVKGTAQDPVIFVSIPADEIAIGCDAYGRTNFVSWRQTMERQQARDAFPNGRFPDDFATSENRTTPVRIFQDFVKHPQSGWDFRVSLDDNAGVGFVATNWTRTQPIAVPRYYRVPGEAYGRGPLLLALPSIKTLNKAQELALKSAAIQMLGIWGFRAGGTFNPDTVRVGPGQFWPMQATGGVLGPDVTRIDPASGRMDVAELVIGNLRDDIKAALYDNRLPEGQGTPRSASEIVARLRQKAEVHVGAFGRLTREINPVIVPRVAEILFDHGYLPAPVRIDQLLVSLSVQSPMAAALNAERLAGIANYIEFIGAIAGPDQVPVYADIDAVLGEVGRAMHIPKRLIPTPEKQQEIRAAQQAQQAELFAAEMARAAAPKLVEGAMQE